LLCGAPGQGLVVTASKEKSSVQIVQTKGLGGGGWLCGKDDAPGAWKTPLFLL
jgi:hypothetical protein